MHYLFKQTDRDFVILNLTDVQLCECQWDKNDPGYDNSFDVMDHTVRTLIQRVKPDLITVTGDMSSCDQPKAYPAFADYIDAFDIPWCVTWGNHDQQEPEGIAFVDTILPYYRSCKNFIHEDGDPALGNGNYLIGIKEGDAVVHTLFMVDSHNCVYLPDENGEPKFAYAKLNEAQLCWYQEQAAWLKEQGCTKSSVLMHIPVYAYNDAWKAAFREDLDPNAVTLEQSYGADCWNEGYEDSFGVRYEGICSYPYEDGVFAVIKEAGITQNVIVGHDHNNNFAICYQGVNLVFATKTGKGCYWKNPVNGGTVLTIGADGSSKIHHEYVDVNHLLQPYDFK